MKIAFNITFHWQLPQLKFHLNNILNFNISSNCQYVLVSAHKENLTNIRDYLNTDEYKDKNVQYLFIKNDPGGPHLGCTHNVIEGIKYIRDNLEYDYLINVEADNMFYFEDKILKLIDKMQDNNKHMLLIDHPSCLGNELSNTQPGAPMPYFITTTLNIYSKYFVDNHLPLEYNKELMQSSWCGVPGTPFEPYLCWSFCKKHNLTTEQSMRDYFNKWSYFLHYDRDKSIYPDHTEPDNLTPDKFMKYGILNCPNGPRSSRSGGGYDSEPNAWERAKKFIEVHTPLAYEFD